MDLKHTAATNTASLPSRERTSMDPPDPSFVERSTPISFPVDRAARVLVVEDEADLRDTVAAFLRDQRFAVDTAASGVDALASIEREVPTCIVLDMFLPIMSGWQLADELKRRGLSIPIIAVTAAYNARTWAERVGAVAHVPKPVSLPSLVHKIDQICAYSESELRAG